MYDGSFENGFGMQKIGNVMKEAREGGQCYHKGVGKDDCPDGMVLVCYWFDHVGVDAWCLTIKETGVSALIPAFVGILLKKKRREKRKSREEGT